MKWSDFLQVAAGKDNPFKEAIAPLIEEARKQTIGTKNDFIQGNAMIAYHKYKQDNNINTSEEHRKRNYLRLQNKKK